MKNYVIIKEYGDWGEEILICDEISIVNFGDA